MLIGKAAPAVSAISTASADRIEVRGRDLTAELMGRIGFTAYFYLLVTGKEPTEQQRFFLDLLLVAIAEHGLVPSVQAARMTLAADPAALQGAVAAGVLGAGSVVLGASESCGILLKSIEVSGDARSVLAEMKAKGERAPGFGHPIHKPVDPRAERVLALAEEHKLQGHYLKIARALPPLVAEIWGKPLPMNVSMAIAAVLLDLDFPPHMLKAIPILARTASLLAHLAEEQKNPIGFLMASKGEEAIGYGPLAGDQS
jgi:citrate synthase